MLDLGERGGGEGRGEGKRWELEYWGKTHNRNMKFFKPTLLFSPTLHSLKIILTVSK